MDEYHYMDADDETADYLTAEVESSFARQEASYEKTRESAEKLLNLLVAGVGGAALLLFNLMSSSATWILIGLGATAFGWFGCVIYLLEKCIRARQRPTMFSRPSVLYFDDARNGEKVTLRDLKRFRIYDKEAGLGDLIKINHYRANILNRVRNAAVICPMAGIVSAALLFQWSN